MAHNNKFLKAANGWGFLGVRGRCLRKWGSEQLKRGTKRGELVVYVKLLPPNVSSHFSSLSVKWHIAFHSKFYQVQTSSTSGSVYLSPPNASLAAVYWRQILVY